VFKVHVQVLVTFLALVSPVRVRLHKSSTAPRLQVVHRVDALGRENIRRHGGRENGALPRRRRSVPRGDGIAVLHHIRVLRHPQLVALVLDVDVVDARAAGEDDQQGDAYHRFGEGQFESDSLRERLIET